MVYVNIHSRKSELNNKFEWKNHALSQTTNPSFKLESILGKINSNRHRPNMSKSILCLDSLLALSTVKPYTHKRNSHHSYIRIL